MNTHTITFDNYRTARTVELEQWAATADDSTDLFDAVQYELDQRDITDSRIRQATGNG